MKKEYLVTGKMSDGNDYSHTVIATNEQTAIEQAMKDWSHDVDSIYYYFTELKATAVYDRIAELEFELKVATSFTWILIILSLIMGILTIVSLMGVK